MDKCFVTVVLRKEVPDQATAKVLVDLVKTRMADKPEVKVTGSYGTQFDAVVE